MLKKIGRFLWFLLAIGCLILATRYYEDIGAPTAKESFVILSLPVLFWVFIILGIGGKKGIPFASGVVTFVACSFGFWQLINRLPEFYDRLYGCAGLSLKDDALMTCAERAVLYGAYRQYLFLAAVALALLAVLFATAFVGIGVHGLMRLFDKPKTVPAPITSLPIPRGGGRRPLRRRPPALTTLKEGEAE